MLALTLPPMWPLPLVLGEHKLQLLIFGTATTGQSVEIINKFTALPWAAMARNSGPGQSRTVLPRPRKAACGNLLQITLQKQSRFCCLI